jgi:hypothetical protein
LAYPDKGEIVELKSIIIGNEEVGSSNLLISSKRSLQSGRFFLHRHNRGWETVRKRAVAAGTCLRRVLAWGQGTNRKEAKAETQMAKNSNNRQAQSKAVFCAQKSHQWRIPRRFFGFAFY